MSAPGQERSLAVPRTDPTTNLPGLERSIGPALLEHLQQILVFMPLLPRGEKTEAHTTSHGSLLEPGQFFLRDRVLNRIKVQNPPRLDEREPRQEFREDRLEQGPDTRKVLDRARAIAKGMTLTTDGPVSTHHARNEVVLVHSNVDQLTAKNPHPLLSPTHSMVVHVPARPPINTSAPPSARLNPFAADTAQPGMATAS